MLKRFARTVTIHFLDDTDYTHHQNGRPSAHITSLTLSPETKTSSDDAFCQQLDTLISCGKIPAHGTFTFTSFVIGQPTFHQLCLAQLTLKSGLVLSVEMEHFLPSIHPSNHGLPLRSQQNPVFMRLGHPIDNHPTIVAERCKQPRDCCGPFYCVASYKTSVLNHNRILYLCALGTLLMTTLPS